MTKVSRFMRLGAIGGVGLLLAISVHSGVGAAPSTPDVIPDQYIIVFHEWVANPGNEARVLAAQHGLVLLYIYEHALKGFAATVPARRLALLSRDPRVDFFSADRAVSIAQQTLPTGVDRIEGELSSHYTSNTWGGIAVAVIDTGSGPHSDLNIAGGKNCSTGKSYNDGNGHGTHVAGTIGAINNLSGVVGVAPGVPIYSVRVLNNAGTGTLSSVICGVDWVTANAASKGIKVANMSLGGGGTDYGNCGNGKDALHKTICNSVNNAGVTYVVAAGNSTVDFAGFVPAAYNEVLTVTAMADFNGQPGGGAAATCRADVDETAADFSNFTTTGSSDEGHTIAAPGVCINSTWKGGEYNTISGTSMASPHAAGTVALCIAVGTAPAGCAGMTPAQIIAKLRGDAAVQPASYGFGGDPNAAIGTRYYGYLVFTGGY